MQLLCIYQEEDTEAKAYIFSSNMIRYDIDKVRNYTAYKSSLQYAVQQLIICIATILEDDEFRRVLNYSVRTALWPVPSTRAQ